MLKDVTGREVTLAAPAKRLLIDAVRFLIALAHIHRDPVSVLAVRPLSFCFYVFSSRDRNPLRSKMLYTARSTITWRKPCEQGSTRASTL